MKLLKLSIQLFTVALLQSCELIEYHPYDSNISGSTDLNEKNKKLIEEHCANKEIIRFAVISDTQRWYDETKTIIKSINARNDIDFVIHCGDQTDFGLTKEFLWMRDVLLGFKMPFICLIGNHDCLGSGEEVFRKIYGAENLGFDAGFVHFSCLNTNAFEYDYSVAIPDFSFVEQDQANLSPKITSSIAVMHSPPMSEQFNNNVAKPFHSLLKAYPNLMFCIHGHSHHTTIDELFKDGHLYYQCGSAGKYAYLVFTITKTGYTYETFGK